MSDRANAVRYNGASNINIPTMPNQGGGGLLDILTGNTPRNLLRQQQSFAGSENEKSRQHEDEMNAKLNEYQQQIMKLEAKLKEDFAVSEYGRQQAAKAGITSEQWASKVAPLATQKAVADMQNQVSSMGTDAVKNATTQGEVANKLQSTVPLTMASKDTTPMGAVSTMTDYARQQGQSPDVTRGSLPTQNVSMAPTMMNPQTGKPMMFSPVTTQGNTPGSFSPGSNSGIPFNPGALQGPMPVDPSIRANILGSQANLTGSDTPPDSRVPTMPQQPTMPVPNAQQPLPGQVPTMPPQGQGGGIMDTLKGLMGPMNTMNPTNLPSKGQMADPNTLNQWLMNILQSTQSPMN